MPDSTPTEAVAEPRKSAELVIPNAWIKLQDGTFKSIGEVRIPARTAREGSKDGK